MHNLVFSFCVPPFCALTSFIRFLYLQPFLSFSLFFPLLFPSTCLFFSYQFHYFSSCILLLPLFFAMDLLSYSLFSFLFRFSFLIPFLPVLSFFSLFLSIIISLNGFPSSLVLLSLLLSPYFIICKVYRSFPPSSRVSISFLPPYTVPYKLFLRSPSSSISSFPPHWTN